MDHLGICAHGEIDQASEAFLRLLGDRESNLVQCERVVLVVEYSRWNSSRSTDTDFDISIRVRIPGIDITAHADPRRFEDLVESRDRGGFGLGEHRGRGCENRGYGRSDKKFFHCWTFLL